LRAVASGKLGFAGGFGGRAFVTDFGLAEESAIVV
jgi:hypothetical protein